MGRRDMTETTEGTNRRPYVKPVVKNLDASDTESKPSFIPVETIFASDAASGPS